MSTTLPCPESVNTNQNINECLQCLPKHSYLSQLQVDKSITMTIISNHDNILPTTVTKPINKETVQHSQQTINTALLKMEDFIIQQIMAKNTPKLASISLHYSTKSAILDFLNF